MSRRHAKPTRRTGASGACADFSNSIRHTRREVLRIGALGGCSLTLPGLLRARAHADTTTGTFGRAKQIIMLYLHGGHPQQETFDPKPDGPSAYRGEFGAIATSVPGVQFGELLPLSAQLMHKVAVVRSMSHGNANHVQAALPAQSGHAHDPSEEKRGDFPPSSKDFPPVGAVLDHLRPAGELPTWVRIGPYMHRNNGTMIHGQTPGFLGDKHASFGIDQPLLPADVRIKAIEPNPDLTSLRLKARRDLLQQVDAQLRIMEQSGQAQNVDAFYGKAFDLLSGEKVRQAFHLAQEPAAVRAKYGRTEFGQRCLLARRLVEAGVPMTNVHWCYKPGESWDTHSKHFSKTKNSLCPTLDPALTALIDDLDERGLLDETLVVVNAEFGRTPKINRSRGRDHWPWAYSLLIAGAGIRGGAVYGASDEAAAYVTAHPHDPKDFIATLYHLLGVPADTTLYDNENRPHHLVIGRPITGILA